MPSSLFLLVSIREWPLHRDLSPGPREHESEDPTGMADGQCLATKEVGMQLAIGFILEDAWSVLRYKQVAQRSIV